MVVEVIETYSHFTWDSRLPNDGPSLFWQTVAALMFGVRIKLGSASFSTTSLLGSVTAPATVFGSPSILIWDVQ
jgi:hypothetical protein